MARHAAALLVASDDVKLCYGCGDGIFPQDGETVSEKFG